MGRTLTTHPIYIFGAGLVLGIVSLFTTIQAVPDLFSHAFGLETSDTKKTLQITYGKYEDWTGNWSIEKNGHKFECTSTHSYKPKTAYCIYIEENNYVAIKQDNIDPNDTDCNFWGTRNGNDISGYYMCGTKKHWEIYDWNVVV